MQTSMDRFLRPTVARPMPSEGDDVDVPPHKRIKSVSTGIDRLPITALQRVFHYLSVQEYHAFSLVCREFRFAQLQVRLLRVEPLRATLQHVNECHAFGIHTRAFNSLQDTSRFLQEVHDAVCIIKHHSLRPRLLRPMYTFSCDHTVLPKLFKEAYDKSYVKIFERYSPQNDSLPLDQKTKLMRETQPYQGITKLVLPKRDTWCFPQEICSCTKLQIIRKLDQDFHDVVGDCSQRHLFNFAFYREIPPEIGQLTDLRELKISGAHLKTLPSQMGELKNLHTLCVVDNDIQHLPESIGGCKNLKILNVSHNALTSLPKTLPCLTRLTKLHVGHNCIKELPQGIFRLRNLRFLSIEDNPVNMIVLVPILNSCTQLSQVTLDQKQKRDASRLGLSIPVTVQT